MQTHYPLKERNTFHFNISAETFSEIDHPETLREIILKNDTNTPILILGGGSNLLFRDNFNGHIIRSTDETIEIISDDGDSVLVRAAAGTDWDKFVEYTVNQNLGGLENLSLIPGTVGASPIQNIGAYGVEVKDYIEYVEGMYLDTGEMFQLEKEACRFGYRDSVFKNELKHKVFISHVVFRLSRKHTYKLDYGKLKEAVETKGEVSLKSIREAVIEIREAKLPDPDKIGNAGSFFKNPVVNETHLQLIQKDYPKAPYYTQEDGYKIPAGWLIDTAGWKGYRKGDAGVHKHQALVLVNYGEAMPSDVLELAEMICRDVQLKFGIELEMEVTIV